MLTLLSGLMAGLCVVPALEAAPPALEAAPPARRAHLTVETLDVGDARARGVSVVFDAQGEGGQAVGLQVEASAIEVPAAKLALSRVAWRCERIVLREPLVCEGPLRVAGRDAGRLAIDLAAARTDVAWRQGRRSLRVEKDLASAWRIAAQRIPLAWLDGVLRDLWPEGRLGDGRVSGRGTVVADRAGLEVDADLQVSDLGFDTPDGRFAAASLDAPVSVRYVETATGTRLRAEGRLAGGEALAGPIYLAVPEAGVGFLLEAESGPDGAWRLPRWRWDDAAALVAEGRARIGADGRLLALDLDARMPDLALMRQRYLDGVLAPAGFGDLQMAGRGAFAMALDEEGLASLETSFQQALAVDPRGRFSLAGVQGDLRWSRDATVADSRLGWSAASLYGIGIEAGQLDFRSREGRLTLAQPLRAGMLGGHLRLDRFVWRPPRGEAPVRIEMGLALEALDLGSLSQRLGWPDFEGTLGGTLPNALYENNRVTFEGGLAMQLFGGEVRIDDVAVERPFGIAPSLAADVRFQDIDLAPLTGAFGFGEITGRLDGRIRDLRLVDWTPVAFDARLLTDRNWPGRRRISQRAVQDISDLGGSGLVAGLQARLLQVFDDFGYTRIGIGCVLKDNRCRMSGLKKRGAGFVIVEGRGLPRIEVVGFRRDVDWPTLVSRLKDATEGDTLRIE